MSTIHRTKISRTEPGIRSVVAQSIDGVHSTTAIKARLSLRGQFVVEIEQIERLPRHKRGVSRNVEFTISRAGFEHLCGLGTES